MAKMRRATCPSCGIALSARESSIGSVIRCKNCGAKIRLSEPEEEPEKPKPSVLAGCCGLAVLLGIACLAALIYAGLKKNREEAAAELQKADRDYERGEKAAAVAVYKHRFAFAEDKAQALKRIVEHETEAANEAEARQWIERGIREKIAAGYAGAAGRLYAQAKKEHDDAEARKLAEKKAQEEARKQGVAVVASDLRAEYGRSQAEADRKYKGKTVTITGRLNKVIREGIAEGVADDIVVVVDEDAEPFIQCYFALKHDGALARLSPGQAVVIRGRCAGIHQPTREIRVRGCELVP
jgi:DNA-directed RNA polymerase subunit RPC12/RpoP